LRHFLAFIIFCSGLHAADYPAPVTGDFRIANFEFASGEKLPELKLHYTTVGTPRGNNGVLILHGTGGAGHSFLSQQFAGVLFGPGQLLDATKYFIILPDGPGHGESSKPSDGLRAHFPKYGYGDMVAAQYRLVTEGLHQTHLRLVMGTSMGGMQTWMWGEQYPAFMDALMPLASAPVQIAGRNRMLRRTIVDSIRDDPEWKNGDYTEQPRGLTTAMYGLMFMLSVPLEWHKQASTRDDADRYFDNWIRSRKFAYDANDLLYQFESSADYDPSPGLEKIVAPLFAVNSADDQVNPPELKILDREIKRVKRGRYILLPISDATRGHGTHSLPAIWGAYLGELLALAPGP
jgi:homoserine O-acetyltransferase/O-succinyltransferase